MYALRGGTILHLARNTWRVLPGTEWLAFAVDPESGRLFAADQTTVYELDGTTWNLTGTRLPTFAHCTNLESPLTREVGEIFSLLPMDGRSGELRLV